MDSPAGLFQSALAKFGVTPLADTIISRFYAMIMVLFCVTTPQPSISLPERTYVVTSDPLEDADDDAMWLFCFLNTNANLIVVVSAGYHSSDTRLQYMKDSYPSVFGNIEFDVPYYRPDGSRIICKKDGCSIDVPLDGFVNAGPCHSTTLGSIGANLKKTPETRVITVGANDDCSLGTGINQKQTDTIGTLVNLPDVWNGFITQLFTYGITCKNLSVDISRHVLFPNPMTMPGSAYQHFMGNDAAMIRFVANTGMFIASRPPPKFALRVNQGNSVICMHYMQAIMAGKTEAEIQSAFAKLQEYTDLCKTQCVSMEVAEAAAIPIVFTQLLGGVYKDGQFGWAHGDYEAKMSAACLTPESAVIFKENVSKLSSFTPMYDVCAFLMLLPEF